MQKNIILLTFMFTFIGCSIREKPKFINIENIVVKEATLDFIELKADALFLNVNDIGGTIQSNGVGIYVNDVFIANLSAKPFEVPSNEKFTIPLDMKISTQEVFKKDKNGVLGGLLGSLINKKVSIQYKGSIVYKKLGFSYEYEVNTTKDIIIKFK